MLHEINGTTIESVRGDSSPLPCVPGGRVFYVLAGRNGVALAAWRVTEYRGRTMAALEWGDAPDVVYSAIAAAYGFTDSFGASVAGAA